MEPAPAAPSRRWRTAGMLVAVSLAGLAGVLAGAEITARSKALRQTRQSAPTVVVVSGNPPQGQPDAQSDAQPTEEDAFAARRVNVAGRDETPEPGIDGAVRLEPQRATPPRLRTRSGPRDGGAATPEDAATPQPSADVAAGAPDAGAEVAAATAAASAVPVICGNVTCPEGMVCCNASCGICAPPGQTCPQQTCGMPYVPVNATCGHNTCAIGQLCCNASCGICVSPGQTCDQRICDNPIVTPVSRSCGMNTCNVDQVCCNPSCGICKRFGEPCSREVCD